MTYSALLTALQDTGIPFADTAWHHAPQSGAYGTLAVDFEAGSLIGDNVHLTHSMSASIDLFARGDGQAQRALVEGVLDDAEIGYVLNSRQYESERSLTHYEWALSLEDV